VKDLFDPLILERRKETIKNTVVQLFKKFLIFFKYEYFRFESGLRYFKSLTPLPVSKKGV